MVKRSTGCSGVASGNQPPATFFPGYLYSDYTIQNHYFFWLGMVFCPITDFTFRRKDSLKIRPVAIVVFTRLLFTGMTNKQTNR